jgi:NADPH:quinone reductase
MRAIQIQAPGGADALRLVELPATDPGPGEVRVRHAACGINFIDIYHRSGLYPVPLPAVLGSEGAGVVDAVGSGVAHLAVGDRVAYAARSPGSYAELRTLDAMQVVRIPDSLDFARAASVMLKGLTVQFLLRRTRPQRDLEPGDFVLWHAAAGGVGLLACRWASALGLQLIGTAGGAEKCARAKAAGAAHVIDYEREDVVARVRELTGGRGVPVVYDSVGKATWERSLDCLEPFGLMVSFGNASGAPEPVALRQLLLKGSLHVTRPSLTTHLATRAAIEAMTGELFAMITSGKLPIDAPTTFPLAEAGAAHRALESRATTGALVLVP